MSVGVAPTATRLLVLSRGGALWAIDHAQVRSVEAVDGAYRVRLVEAPAGAAAADDDSEPVEELAAEAVEGVAEGLPVHPARRLLGRYWDPSARGLALHRQRPVVVVEAHRPPALLLPTRD